MMVVAGVRDVPVAEDAGVQLDQRDGDRPVPEQQSAAVPAVHDDRRRVGEHRARLARARSQHGHHRPGQRESVSYTVVGQTKRGGHLDLWSPYVIWRPYNYIFMLWFLLLVLSSFFLA